MDLELLPEERCTSLSDSDMDALRNEVDEFRYTRKNGSQIELKVQEKKYVLLFLHLYGKDPDKVNSFLVHLFRTCDLPFRYV